MSTPARLFQNGIPYHIYNRGNRKNKIFISIKDYRRFMEKLKEYKDKFKIEFLCYCLMPNHFHFLLIQYEESVITKFMLRLSTSYSKYFNIKYHLVGRLFQERFRAKMVDTDEYLVHLSRYIHLNPNSDDFEDINLTAGVGAKSGGYARGKLYPWTSLSEYLNRTNEICNTFRILNYFSQNNANLSYRKFIEGGLL